MKSERIMPEQQKRPIDNYKEELAKRLCAAHVSVQMGLTLQYAYKRYIEDSEIGEYWLALADKVISDMAAGSFGPASH